MPQLGLCCRPLFYLGGAGGGGKPLDAEHSDCLLLCIQVSRGTGRSQGPNRKGRALGYKEGAGKGNGMRGEGGKNGHCLGGREMLEGAEKLGVTAE